MHTSLKHTNINGTDAVIFTYHKHYAILRDNLNRNYPVFLNYGFRNMLQCLKHMQNDGHIDLLYNKIEKTAAQIHVQIMH